MSDSDASPVRRRVVNKKKKIATPVKKTNSKQTKQPVVKKGKGRSKIVESSSESDSSSDSDSDREDEYKLTSSDESLRSESDNDSKHNRHNNRSAADLDSEDEREHRIDSSIPEGGFKLPTDPAIMVFCGSCAAGKSYMLRYCMWIWAQMKFFGFGLCFCPTAFNGQMAWLPERALKEEYSEEYLEAYITNLRQKTKEGKAKHGMNWELPPNFVIFDDCLSMLVGSKFFNNWVSTFRHTNTYPIILTQYLAASRSVSTLLRNCTNYAFLWPQSLKNSLQAMHAAYGQLFDNYDDFCKELKKCRERKYSCLVYKNSPDFTTKEEAYCRVKAGEFPENFTIKF